MNCWHDWASHPFSTHMFLTSRRTFRGLKDFPFGFQDCYTCVIAAAKNIYIYIYICCTCSIHITKPLTTTLQAPIFRGMRSLAVDGENIDCSMDGDTFLSGIFLRVSVQHARLSNVPSTETRASWKQERQWVLPNAYCAQYFKKFGVQGRELKMGGCARCAKKAKSEPRHQY